MHLWWLEHMFLEVLHVEDKVAFTGLHDTCALSHTATQHWVECGVCAHLTTQLADEGVKSSHDLVCALSLTNLAVLLQQMLA